MPTNRESLASFVCEAAALSGFPQARLADAAGATESLVAQWRRGVPLTERREASAVGAVGDLFAHRARCLAFAVRGMGSGDADLLARRADIAARLVPALIELAEACTETMRASADAKSRDAALAARAAEFVFDLAPSDLDPPVTAEYVAQAGRGTGPVFDLINGQAVLRP